MRSRARGVRYLIVLCAVVLTVWVAVRLTPTGQQAAGQQATGQSAANQVAAEQQAEDISPEAAAYLNKLLDLMQQHSINRLTIDWDDFRAKVLAKAAGAESIEETRLAISEALKLLADRHSSYTPKVGSRLRWGGCTTAAVSPAPVGVAVPRTVGYVRVTGFQGTGKEADIFAENLQEAIKAADGPEVTAWIVDLRGNTGGNMWPMITGLSPILGDGPLGYFVGPTGEKVAWELRDGVAYIDTNMVQQNQAPYRLQHESPRVAVLTDELTGSSGEAVAIAFRGRPDTRSFGIQTCGLSTGNATYQLSDGAMLTLTVAVDADRTGQPYGGPVVPDEVINDSDKLAQRALEWLQTGR